MLKIKVKKGHDINIAGVASRDLLATQKNTTVSLSPENFRYINLNVLKQNNFNYKKISLIIHRYKHFIYE